MYRKYHKIILYGILLFAGVLRLYGMNWDQGNHLHPDERAIILAVVEMSFPNSIAEFFSPGSSWNPNFFAYGSFPFYLLRIAGDITGSLLHPLFAEYDGINLVGRVLSAFFDIGTVFLIYLLGKRFFTLLTGLMASFFYAVSVLPIQLSHFYAVDTLLTFFVVATLYFSLTFFEERKIRHAVLMGGMFGLALATKISAVILILPILVSFGFLLFPRRDRHHNSSRISFTQMILLGSCFLATAEILFFITEPYAIIDAQRFLRDTLTQSEMTKDAFTFPYTLQYVGKIPYLYELKNILFFGMGIPLALLCFSGTGYLLVQLLRKKHFPNRAFLILLFCFFIPYFLVVGNFKVGFMRYMLPLYPFFCLFGALFLLPIGTYFYKKTNSKLFALYSLLFTVVLLIWPLGFMKIYTQPNTRVTATEWIHNTIPHGSTIAIEHWDDSLPITGQENYTMVTLPLYDTDSLEKWETINRQLLSTDYIILASNRLYTPLMKLTDCERLPEFKCYKQTARYYQTLFSETGDFRKVIEFTNYPKLEIGPPTGGWKLEIRDEEADESFTVYDHPKIMIYKRK